MESQQLGADAELDALLKQKETIEQQNAQVAKRQAEEIADRIVELLEHPAYAHVHGRRKMAIAKRAAEMCGGNWKLVRTDEPMA